MTCKPCWILSALLLLALGGHFLRGAVDNGREQTCQAPLGGVGPTLIVGLPPIVSISASGSGIVGFAIDNDGGAWAWRALGSCKQVPPTKFIPDRHVASTRALTSGIVQRIVLSDDGHVWESVPNGLNKFNQLGTVQTGELEIPGLHDIKAVAAGADHSLALQASGIVWAWGANDCGQSGQPTSMSGTSPILPIQQLRDVIAIGAGFRHSLALKRDGTVWQWGNLSSAEFEASDVLTPAYGFRYCAANGQPAAFQTSAFPQTSPAQVTGLPPVVALATYYNHNLALGRDGEVWGWGVDDCGQTGPFDQRASKASAPINGPTKVAGLDHVIAIATGRRHSLALKSDGSVWAWGDNEKGQITQQPASMAFDDRCLEQARIPLGAPHSTRPIRVKGLPPIKAITASAYSSAALDYQGQVWFWGRM